ncbi:MAG TPA: PHP domain-containing protein [Desulfotomaculum sp.]|nr:MAG: hypothetical protein VR67_10815 [Peptococcaceae bacterium BRH_c8a]KJS71820.1 MAG: hypothetical protein JL56_14135 [Desulfotomaculum sp. BICA1-6]HBX23866.1 PHP domain-containing protein [Desulfotomaculum sp.]
MALNSKILVPGCSLPGAIPLTENHVHTTFSDGRNTVEEYVNAALQQGIKSMVFTEHVNRGCPWFDDYINEIKRVRRKYVRHIEVYAGIEAKTLDFNGSIDATREMMAACDVVVGVVHRCPDPAGGMLEYTELDGSTAQYLEYRAAKGLLEKGDIHILGHMGGMHEYFYGPFPDPLYLSLIRIAHKKGCAVELNGRHHPRLSKLVAYCRRYNPWVSLGSDAHDTGEIGLIHRRLKELNI